MSISARRAELAAQIEMLCAAFPSRHGHLRIIRVPHREWQLLRMGAGHPYIDQQLRWSDDVLIACSRKVTAPRLVYDHP